MVNKTSQDRQDQNEHPPKSKASRATDWSPKKHTEKLWDCNVGFTYLRY